MKKLRGENRIFCHIDDVSYKADRIKISQAKKKHREQTKANLKNPIYVLGSYDHIECPGTYVQQLQPQPRPAMKYKITILDQESGFETELYFDGIDVRQERGMRYDRDELGNVVKVVPRDDFRATIRAWANCGEFDHFKTDTGPSKRC